MSADLHMITQNPKDPVWTVTLRSKLSDEPSVISGPDGLPARSNVTYSEPTEITVHAPDADTAKAYVVQQNPDVSVVSAVKT